MGLRQVTIPDRLCDALIDAIRVVSGVGEAARPNPAKNAATSALPAAVRRESAAFMRVNHSGEVCAQALYRGQATVARTPEITALMQQCAAEETDHLVWCQERLKELQSHRSVLSPFWYVNAYLIGMVVGLCGDAISLGFVRETERQVEAHLAGHLARLDVHDAKSRAIILQMQQDESHHADTAGQQGARELPLWVQGLMRLHAKVMTTVAHWV